MLTSALCPKCHHQLILPSPKPSPFYQNLHPPASLPTHAPSDCQNVVLNVAVNLKIELPQPGLADNVTVVSKTLQCGGGIVLPHTPSPADDLKNPVSDRDSHSTTCLERNSSTPHVRSIESTYPIGVDESRTRSLASAGQDAVGIRLNQQAVTLNIPLSREICQRDLDTLTATVRVLRMSGFYYESIMQQEALELLANKSPGTFLVRNSSNPQHIFALSVQTMKGPTSVRLNYLNGFFYFDCEDHLTDRIAKFPCVLQLIEHYIRTAAETAASSATKQQVWLDYFTRKYYSRILLVKPHRREMPKLQQLCRSAVYRHSVPVPSNSIPFSLICYLKAYPYAL